MSGAVTDYGPTQQASIISVLAREASVPPSHVTLTLTSGSVIITAEIFVPTARQAEATASTLSAGILSTPTTLQWRASCRV